MKGTRRAKTDVVVRAFGRKMPVIVPLQPYAHLTKVESASNYHDILLDFDVEANDVDKLFTYYDGVFWNRNWSRLHALKPYVVLDPGLPLFEQIAPGAQLRVSYQLPGGKYVSITAIKRSDSKSGPVIVQIFVADD